MSGYGLHECHWPGCTARVPTEKWGCKHHWYRLPRHLREKLCSAWFNGGTREYMAVHDEIDRWCRENVTTEN